MRHLRTAAALTCAAALAPAAPALADNHRTESTGPLSLVANVPYEAKNGTTANYGTDIEFAEIDGRRYAFAGSYRNGMQIFDISDPATLTKDDRVGVYDCGVTQGDVQIFRQADEPGRVFATYTSDTYGDGTSTCYREAAALGFDVRKPNGTGRNGTFIVDVTNPSNPRTVSFAAAPKGSHNLTVHPSGDYMYNSNSDLITSVLGAPRGDGPAIEVFDIRDLSKPALAKKVPLPIRPGLGTESHDITFNERGDRAYSAALSQGVILDTKRPGDPKILTSFLDPTINVWHQSDPFRTVGPRGEKREFLIVEDEFAGAIGTGQCPNGGVHVYETTGDLELAPRKIGFWNIDDLGPTHRPDDSCTAHVFDIHEDEAIMTIAYYNGGVRVVDLSGLATVGPDGEPVGKEPLEEIASFRQDGADTWSAKTPEIDPATGDFWLFGNDIARGLDVYRFDGGTGGAATTDAGKKPKQNGRWQTAEEHRATAPTVDARTWPGPLDLLREQLDEHEGGGHGNHAH